MIITECVFKWLQPLLNTTIVFDWIKNYDAWWHWHGQSAMGNGQWALANTLKHGKCSLADTFHSFDNIIQKWKKMLSMERDIRRFADEKSLRNCSFGYIWSIEHFNFNRIWASTSVNEWQCQMNNKKKIYIKESYRMYVCTMHGISLIQLCSLNIEHSMWHILFNSNVAGCCFVLPFKTRQFGICPFWGGGGGRGTHTNLLNANVIHALEGKNDTKTINEMKHFGFFSFLRFGKYRYA